MERVPRRMPTSALRSMATPTGCFWSTRPPGDLRLLTTAMVARSILAKHPGATILHNMNCSKTVPEVIAEGGGTAVRTRVGHSFIKQVMAETGALFGGEHSGHYYFADNFRADSGLIAALVILEALSNHDGGLADLVSSLDRYAASGEINTTVDDAAAVIDHVADVYSAGTGPHGRSHGRHG